MEYDDVKEPRWTDEERAALQVEFDAFVAERESNKAKLSQYPTLLAQRDILKAAIEQIANGGPLEGQRTGPMKMYQAQAVARAALAACKDSK